MPVLRSIEERKCATVHELRQEHIPNIILRSKWSQGIFRRDLQQGESFNPFLTMKKAEELEIKLKYQPAR